MFSLTVSVLSAIKTMNLLRVFKNFGKLVQLLTQVFADTRSFLFFYFIWLLYFVVYKQLIGSGVDES